MARWLSWLERRPVTAEVDGSNPFRVAPVKEGERTHYSNAFFLLFNRKKKCSFKYNYA